MKKIITIAIILLVGGIFVWNYNIKPTDIDLATVSQINNESTGNFNQNNLSNQQVSYIFTDFDFQFTGYGPAGRFHVGVIDSEIRNNNQIVFDMTSVSTDEGQNQRLDNHLCQDDFFSCDIYQESIFTLNSIEIIDQNSSRINGTFELKDVTKNLSFVAESQNAINESNNSADYQGRFLLDTTEFGFRVPIVEPEVLIEFNFSVTREIEEIIVEEDALDNEESEEDELDGDDPVENLE